MRFIQRNRAEAAQSGQQSLLMIVVVREIFSVPPVYNVWATDVAGGTDRWFATSDDV